MIKTVLNDGGLVEFNNESVNYDFRFFIQGKFPWMKDIEYMITPKKFYLVTEKAWIKQFKAGADAKLEELRKRGVHHIANTPTVSINLHPLERGTLVFIPDDEEATNEL